MILFSKNLEYNLESDGKLILLDIPIQMQDFLLKWDSMLSFTLVLIIKKKIKELKKKL